MIETQEIPDRTFFNSVVNLGEMAVKKMYFVEK